MFNIDIEFDDISIKSIEKDDVHKIQQWITNVQCFNIYDQKNFGINEFYERYLEYYVSEGEYFLKILCNSKLVGIIKGRIEFKNPNEVWIMYYLIDNDLYTDDVRYKIIKQLLNHLYHNYGISRFYTFVSRDNCAMLKFWKNNGFEISRVTNNFLNVDNQGNDMLILKKQIET